MNIDDFVIELRMRGVQYDPVEKKHWIGSKFLEEDDDDKIVTNVQMRTMCSKFFGREYNLLTPQEQRLIREDIFRKLRGGENG